MTNTLQVGQVVRILAVNSGRVIHIGAVTKVKGELVWVHRFGGSVEMGRVSPLKGATN